MTVRKRRSSIPVIVKPISDPAKQPKVVKNIQQVDLKKPPCSFCMETRKRVKKWFRLFKRAGTKEL